MPQVFLTGASGFAGRVVAQRLRARGCDVTGLSRQTAGAPGLIRGALGEPATYQRALTPATIVVHLAALTGVAPEQDYVTTNVDGTAALLSAARTAGVRRVVFASTIAVTFPDLRGYPYAQSKVAGERLVTTSGLAATIVRPTILGGRESPVLSRLTSLARLPIVPLMGGTTRVQPLAVDDLADFVADLVERDQFRGEILELGGRDVVTLRELLDRAHRMAHGKAPWFLPSPLAPVVGTLRIAEAIVGPRLPISVGQMATFRFDGVATPNDLWQSRRDRLASVDDILHASIAI